MFVKCAVIIINLFFIPMISLGILYEFKKPKNLFRFFVAYFKSVVLCFIFSMIAGVMVLYLFEIPVAVHSVKYTIITTVIAFVWPYIFKNLEIKFEKSSKNTLEENKKDEETKEPELAGETGGNEEK